MFLTFYYIAQYNAFFIIMSASQKRTLAVNIFLIMNKASLVEKVQGVLGGTKADAERAVEALFDAITGEMKKGGEVSVAGFGIFSVKKRAARTARNPRTGETVKVPAMNVPKFRAAKALKDTVK